MAADGRSYTTASYMMALDGFQCGIIQKFDGGAISGEVTQLPIAHNYYTAKMIGNVKFDPVTVQVGVAMSKPLQDWVDASLAMNYMRKNCAISALDFKLEERHIREFTDCLLTEVTFPACDGAAKDPAFVSLKLQPEKTRNKKGGGTKLNNPADMKQKMWTPANFRLSIDGCDNAMKKVAKVNAQTFKQTFVADTIGTEREYLNEPSHCEFGDIEVTVSEEYVEELIKWHEDFIINGNNTHEQHKSGSLEFLNQNRQTTLATINFQGLGITKVAAAARTNNEDKIAQYTVNLYVENWTVAWG